jgi:hypothetical protein
MKVRIPPAVGGGQFPRVASVSPLSGKNKHFLKACYKTGFLIEAAGWMVAWS